MKSKEVKCKPLAKLEESHYSIKVQTVSHGGQATVHQVLEHDGGMIQTLIDAFINPCRAIARIFEPLTI